MFNKGTFKQERTLKLDTIRVVTTALPVQLYIQLLTRNAYNILAAKSFLYQRHYGAHIPKFYYGGTQFKSQPRCLYPEYISWSRHLRQYVSASHFIPLTQMQNDYYR